MTRKYFMINLHKRMLFSNQTHFIYIYIYMYVCIYIYIYIYIYIFFFYFAMETWRALVYDCDKELSVSNVISQKYDTCGI